MNTMYELCIYHYSPYENVITLCVSEGREGLLKRYEETEERSFLDKLPLYEKSADIHNAYFTAESHYRINEIDVV